MVGLLFMTPRSQMILCSLLGGLVGGLFCLICFPVSLMSGAIAVGLYLRIKPEIYITASQATAMGAGAGVFAAFFSTVWTWLLFSRMMSVYEMLLGQTAADLLQMELDSYGSSVFTLFTINLGLTFLFGILGGWMSLRWVYHENRIPKDL